MKIFLKMFLMKKVISFTSNIVLDYEIVGQDSSNLGTFNDSATE